MDPIQNYTLYFRYTYGKPVKGQLQVKVCYNSPYGYGWRRRGPQFIRPCTERLLEVVILSGLANLLKLTS